MTDVFGENAVFQERVVYCVGEWFVAEFQET